MNPLFALLLTIYFSISLFVLYFRVWFWSDARGLYEKALKEGWDKSDRSYYIRIARDYRNKGVQIFTHPVIWPLLAIKFSSLWIIEEIGTMFALSEELDKENAKDS